MEKPILWAASSALDESSSLLLSCEICTELLLGQLTHTHTHTHAHKEGQRGRDRDREPLDKLRTSNTFGSRDHRVKLDVVQYNLCYIVCFQVEENIHRSGVYFSKLEKENNNSLGRLVLVGFAIFVAVVAWNDDICMFIIPQRIDPTLAHKHTHLSISCTFLSSVQLHQLS